MKQKIICIVCPRGCHLEVDPDNNYAVTGNFCPRGVPYGKSEMINPMRIVTSTVKITGADLCRCPVKTDRPIAKAQIKNVMEAINRVEVKAPVEAGDILIKNVLGTEVNVVSSRSIH